MCYVSIFEKPKSFGPLYLRNRTMGKNWNFAHGKNSPWGRSVIFFVTSSVKWYPGENSTRRAASKIFLISWASSMQQLTEEKQAQMS